MFKLLAKSKRSGLFNWSHLNKFFSISSIKSTTFVKTTLPEMIETNDEEVSNIMSKFMIVKYDFLSEAEENCLLNEIEPYMKKLRYEFDHWDNVN